MQTLRPMAFRGVTSPVTTSANRRNPPAVATATAHRRFAIVAVDVTNPDAVVVLVRDDRFAGNLAQARRHASLLADALAARHACAVDVQVLDVDTGDLLASVQAGGSL